MNNKSLMREETYAGEDLHAQDPVAFHADGWLYRADERACYGIMVRDVRRNDLVWVRDDVVVRVEENPSRKARGRAKPQSGYYRVEPVTGNPYTNASLDELIAQLEYCDYRCEAGPLYLNLAFIELKRRAHAAHQPCTRPAAFRVGPPGDPYDYFYSCAEHLADMVEEGNVVTALDVPASERCGFVARQPQTRAVDFREQRDV